MDECKCTYIKYDRLTETLEHSYITRRAVTRCSYIASITHLEILRNVCLIS